MKIANVEAKGTTNDSLHDDLSQLPDISQPVLLEIQQIKVHGVSCKTMWDNGSTAALMTHSFAEKAGITGKKVSFWLIVVGHDSILRETMLYTFTMVDNAGNEHVLQAFGIDQITEESQLVDLSGVRTMFPGAPKQVFNRPEGEIDLLVGSMYKNLQPYGGDGEFTRGRLRLVKSLFGCGYILTGTHPSISIKENSITHNAHTLVNCAILAEEVNEGELQSPVMSCNRAVTMLKLPEFFEAEELGVTPSRSCKRCRNCRDCSYRGQMISREKEMVVERVEDLLSYDQTSMKVTVGYPWTEDIYKLTDNLRQAKDFQASVERRLLRDGNLDFYNSELQKFIDRGALRKLSQEEMDAYQGPVSYVSHHGVAKPGSTTTPL